MNVSPSVMHEALSIFTSINHSDIPKAKYKVGQVIRFQHPNFTGVFTGRITGVNDTGMGIEYSIDGFPVLLWESEIKEKVNE